MASVILSANALVLVTFGIVMQWGALSTALMVALGLYILSSVMTVWKMGWVYRLIALAYLPELFYSFLLLFVYLRALVDHVRGQTGAWQET